MSAIFGAPHSSGTQEAAASLHVPDGFARPATATRRRPGGVRASGGLRQSGNHTGIAAPVGRQGRRRDDGSLQEGWLSPGEHSAVWDQRDNAGRVVSAGLYFIRFEAAGASFGQMVILIP